MDADKIYKHNDYITLTKNYLREYMSLKSAERNLLETIDGIDLELQDVSVKAAAYGAEQAGGVKELTDTEQAAAKRLYLSRRRWELVQYWRRTSNFCKRMSLALDALSPEERQMVDLYYFDRISYLEMSCITHTSERSCRRQIQQITSRLAVILFGPFAKEQIMFVS